MLLVVSVECIPISMISPMIEVIGAIEAKFAMEIDDELAATAARVSDLLAVIG